MAKTYSRSEFLEQQEFFLEEAQKNKIFVYPTDTIYGIGTIGTEENKEKINRIKQRPADKVLSTIAPSVEWIRKNYPVPNIENIVTEVTVKNLIDYHGGVTFVFDPHFRGGTRIINHGFQSFVTALGYPFITTSVNSSGHPNCYEVSEIHPDILQHVDYIIDQGRLEGEASVLLNLVSGEVQKREPPGGLGA